MTTITVLPHPDACPEGTTIEAEPVINATTDLASALAPTGS